MSGEMMQGAPLSAATVAIFKAGTRIPVDVRDARGNPMPIIQADVFGYLPEMYIRQGDDIDIAPAPKLNSLMTTTRMPI